MRHCEFRLFSKLSLLHSILKNNSGRFSFNLLVIVNFVRGFQIVDDNLKKKGLYVAILGLFNDFICKYPPVLYSVHQVSLFCEIFSSSWPWILIGSPKFNDLQCNHCHYSTVNDVQQMNANDAGKSFFIARETSESDWKQLSSNSFYSLRAWTWNYAS